MVLDVARNGVGEKTPAKGMLIIAGETSRLMELGSLPKRNKFKAEEISVLSMDSEDKGFVYESFIQDGAMIIDGQTGRIISSGYRVASVEIGHDGGGLKHKAASAIAQTGPCLAIKCSEDCCVVDGGGKGDLKVFPAVREPTNVPVPPLANAQMAEMQRKLEAQERELQQLKLNSKQPQGAASSTSSGLVPEGVRACEHFFDMRGAGGDATDRCGSGLMARLQGTARRTEEGVVLNGKEGKKGKKGGMFTASVKAVEPVRSWVKLDPWPIGGPSSFEVYVRYANFDTNFETVPGNVMLTPLISNEPTNEDMGGTSFCRKLLALSSYTEYARCYVLDLEGNPSSPRR